MANDLPEPDRLVTQHLVLAAAVSGYERAEHLLDWLHDLSEPQRRRVLDNTREAVGLPSASDLDRRAATELARQAMRESRDALGRAWQVCGASDCTAMPRDHTGQLVPHPARRWFCPAHEHLAADGDLDPVAPFSGIDFRDYSPIIPAEERERAQREEQERRAEDDRRNRARHAEHEATERAQVRASSRGQAQPAFPGWFG